MIPGQLYSKAVCIFLAHQTFPLAKWNSLSNEWDRLHVTFNVDCTCTRLRLGKPLRVYSGTEFEPLPIPRIASVQQVRY